MSSLLKDRYSPAYVKRLAGAMRAAWPQFDEAGYARAVLGNGWSELELKQRMRRLSSTLHRFLPMPYPRQIAVLKKVAPPFGGFEGMLFPDFVEQFGLDDFDTSARALEQFTQFSSSEFAVRPFIARHGPKMMAVLRRWASHENEHVRRLASEGCRPRLPWAMALPEFKNDPSPVLPILEALKDDPSDYVRRSVANNLNDIAKDHPEVVLKVARRWLGKSKLTDALVKHACRTLLKRGDKRALELFGYRRTTAATVTELRFSTAKLSIGDDLRFQFAVCHAATRPVALRLEYAVDFVKASGRTARKVFKITEGSFAPGERREFDRKHPFRDFTTRKHHPGEHRLSILVNGEVSAEAKLMLARAGSV
jgi:3-methyladenine DNA glycosylase AlkC